MEFFGLPNGVIMPKMVLGSFNIGDQHTMNEMIATAIQQGVNAFDTSPSYGSEAILGSAIKAQGIKREEILLTDKVDGWQMYESDGEVERYLDVSLKALQIDYVDLLLIHWPFERYITKTWNCMERMYRKGKVRAIGLCNMNVRTYQDFREKGIEIKPHVIQNEISPFRTDIDSTLFFQNEGIAVEAYSPLCRMIPDIKFDMVLNSLAKKYGKSIAQIILRWDIERGIIPVFTSSKPQRISENTNIWDFEMEKEDVDRISALNRDYKIFPESFGCPGY